MAYDSLTLCIAILAGQILVAALALWICNAHLPDFRLLPFGDVRPLLRATWPFAVLTILLVLSQRAGILAVSNLMGDGPTGLFSAVSRVVDGLKLGHYAVLGALLPVLSRRGEGSKQSFAKGFLLLLGLSALFGTGLTLFAAPIVDALYGRSFASAAALLPQLGWSLIPYTVSSFISYDLIARGLELTLVKLAGISLVIFVFLYLALISAFGLSGAVWAALAGECVQAVIFILALRYRSNVGPRAAQVEFIHDVS
jgi:O-antigen/teichoic acid export membrane protein